MCVNSAGCVDAGANLLPRRPLQAPGVSFNCPWRIDQSSTAPQVTRAYTSNAKSTVPTHMATAKRTLRTVMVLLDGIAAEAAARRGNDRYVFGDSGDLDQSVGSTEEFVATYACADRRLDTIAMLRVCFLVPLDLVN